MNIRNVTSNSTNQNVGFLIFTCVKIRKVIYLPEKLRAPIANILVSFIALVLVIKLTCLISGEVFSNLVPRLLFGCCSRPLFAAYEVFFTALQACKSTKSYKVTKTAAKLSMAKSHEIVFPRFSFLKFAECGPSPPDLSRL